MPDVIKIAIVEDEELQAQLIRKYVEKWAEEKNIKTIIESFHSGESFNFSWCVDKSYDILLLDIQMPGINGVELVRKIREKDWLINIIFITAIPDYIGEGYEVEAINYLIKPIDKKNYMSVWTGPLKKHLKKKKYY